VEQQLHTLRKPPDKPLMYDLRPVVWSNHQLNQLECLLECDVRNNSNQACSWLSPVTA
jgi:hypothetical protein